LEVNIKLLEQVEEEESKDNRDRFERVSFLNSGAGIYTLGALISHAIGDKEKVKSYIEKVKGYSKPCFTKDVQHGLQEGVAGYLYCLLLL